MIQYRPDTHRKLGFRKVRKEAKDEGQSQLNLFVQDTDPEKTIQILRHLDPFEKGLQLDEKNPAIAEKLYQEAIRNGISVADAHCNLGILHARVGATAKAIASFTKALKEEPTHLEGHYNLANMYYDAGNYFLAATHYEVAWELEGAFPEIAYNLALTNISLDRRAEAIAALKAYLKSVSDEDTKEAQLLLNLLQVDHDRPQPGK